MLVLPGQHQPRLDNVPDDCRDVVIVPDIETLYQYNRDRHQSVVMTPRRISGEFNSLAESLMKWSEYTPYDLTALWELLETTDYPRELEVICRDMAEMQRRTGQKPVLRVVKKYIADGLSPISSFHTDLADANSRKRHERVMCCYNAPVTQGLERQNAIRSDDIYLAKDDTRILRFGVGDIWIQACGQDKSDPYIHRAVEVDRHDPPRLLVVC